MTLELYHLQLSQSERIVWLLEEMKLPYDLKVCPRNPQTALAPDEIKSVNPAGTAPYFQDASVSPPVGLGESGAIVEYILSVYGSKATGTRMHRVPGDPDYVPYLQWLHFANPTLQCSVMRYMSFIMANQLDTPVGQGTRTKLDSILKLLDDQLSSNKFLAGNECTAADCVTIFSLTTMRGFAPYSIEPYSNIQRYLRDVADRPAYREALKKGDDGMEPMIEGRTRKFTHFERFRVSLGDFTSF